MIELLEVCSLHGVLTLFIRKSPLTKCSLENILAPSCVYLFSVLYNNRSQSLCCVIAATPQDKSLKIRSYGQTIWPQHQMEHLSEGQYSLPYKEHHAYRKVKHHDGGGRFSTAGTKALFKIDGKMDGVKFLRKNCCSLPESCGSIT